MFNPKGEGLDLDDAQFAHSTPAFSYKVIAQLLEFRRAIASYFDQQADDYLKLLGSASEREASAFNDILDSNASQPDLPDRSAENPLLRQKMKALAWLVRCSQFITAGKKEAMVQAYRESELSVDNQAAVLSHHSSQKTGSLAIVAVCEAIQDALDRVTEADKPLISNETFTR